jgi:hypothetical protein
LPADFLRKKKNKNLLLTLSLFAIIIISSIYMYNFFYINYARAEKRVDFKIYQTQYKKDEGKIIIWLDQNGTTPCTNVKVAVHPDYEWSFNEVNPEQFIRLEYTKRLNTTKDIPFFQEIFVEYLYLDENFEKKDDKILWIIIDHNDIL